MMEPGILTERNSPGAAPPARVLEFSGRLRYGRESLEHYKQLRAALDEGVRHFVFDLGRVPVVDSTGIGFLVECLTTAGRLKAKLSLAAPSRQVLHALSVTRLSPFFPIFDSVEEALAGAS